MKTILSQSLIERGKGTYFRSNRPLTEFACTNLELFLTGYDKDSTQVCNGNTTAIVTIDGSTKTFQVLLYGEEILNVVKVAAEVISLKVAFTDFYDGFGQPTTTVAERLNGLLDRLGIYQVIPKGTRVFRDKLSNMTYLGRGENKIAVGEKFANFVYIRPSIDDLDIASGFFGSEVVND